MATVREGSKPVMMVVDVQVGVVDGAFESERVIANVALAVQRAREQNVPVIWVQHSDDELVKDSAEWQWAPGLVPADGETRVYKNFNSSFEKTDLDDILAKQGATHITLAGCASNWCIRATAYGALERGYDLTLVQDAHTTKTMDMGNGRKLEAQAIIDDLNVAITWLGYPGRVNGTAKAQELDFSKPVSAK